MTALILIAEDDPQIADILNAYLEREGFRTVSAANGRVAVDLCEVLKPDLVLLDIAMPLMDGWEVLTEIRRREPTPVIMLSALDKDIDRLQGLRFGADDYVVKPFNPVEVVARTKAVLRRVSPTANPMMLRVDPVAIDLEGYQVEVEGSGGKQHLNLTLTEFRILAHLAKKPAKVFTRGELTDACLPGGNALDRTVDSHVSNLRKKLEQAGAVGMLPSIRGVGYRLKALK